MRDQQDDSVATPGAVRALASILLGDGSRDAVLGRACEATRSLIPEADDVSVTLLEPTPYTVAATGDLASRADEVQYAVREGPCLDAATGGLPVLVHDLGEDGRWSDYAPRAVDAGVRASLSVPLEVDGTVAGALNIYSRRSGAFDANAVDVAYDLVHYAAIVSAVTDERERAVALAQQMQQAMQSRAIIEQAKGVIMCERGCSAEDAFDALVRMSQESHLKLRDVAQRLVDEVSGRAARSRPAAADG